jgi:hypothetical protein
VLWPGRSDGAPGSRAALTVPWRTLAGRCQEPGQLSRIGAITAQTARQLARAAAADPTCEWRVIVAGAGGQLVAVTRIRSPGHSPAASARPPGPGVLARITITIPVTLLDEPLPADLANGATDGLSAVLRAVVDAAHQAEACRTGSQQPGTHHAGTGPAGRGTCTHQNAVPSYRIPNRLRALIEARDQDCGFPICRRPASSCDMDHVVPYDQGGLSCECNITGGCRRHHRLKTLTRWRLRKPSPGTLIWTAPSGLTWIVTPEPHHA